MKWTRDGDALVSGPFRIEVIGATSTGRASVWGLKHNGQWVTTSLRGRMRPRAFDRQRDAKDFERRLKMSHT